MAWLFFLAIPVWLFVCIAVMVAVFKLSIDNWSWWAAPLGLTAYMVFAGLAIMGILVLIGFGLKSPFPGTEGWL